MQSEGIQIIWSVIVYSSYFNSVHFQNSVSSFLHEAQRLGLCGGLFAKCFIEDTNF
jgi:hypothetical protein